MPNKSICALTGALLPYLHLQQEQFESVSDLKLHNTVLSLCPSGPPLEVLEPSSSSRPTLTTLPLDSTVEELTAHTSRHNLSSVDDPNGEIGFLTPETSLIDVGLGSTNPNPLPHSSLAQSLLPLRPPTNPNRCMLQCSVPASQRSVQHCEDISFR